MRKIESVNSFDKIKLLADSRRLAIVRLLMASPATLTQLAQTLKQSPAWIRHHVLSLESANLVEVNEIRKTGKMTEKYYRARADALLLQEIVLPKTKKPVLIFSGSHDLALEGVAEAQLVVGGGEARDHECAVRPGDEVGDAPAAGGVANTRTRNRARAG